MKEYILIPYPDYTFYETDEWFDSEATPLDDEKVISQIGMCMFIPKDRVELHGEPFIYYKMPGDQAESKIWFDCAIKGDNQTYFVDEDNFKKMFDIFITQKN